MKYVKTGDVLAVRLDPGEEIIASVLKIAKDEDIRFAEISAIGAVGRAVFGLYDLEEQKYHSLTFVQPLELVSLNGNLSRKDGERHRRSPQRSGDKRDLRNVHQNFRH